MMSFVKVNESIYRLELPYKDIYTTVYLLDSGHGYILFDMATNEEDFAAIRAALSDIGVPESEVAYIFISHHHRDHSGGLRALGEYFPEAVLATRSDALAELYANRRILKSDANSVLLDTYRVIPIVGHTADSAALFDLRSGILITGDSLQAYGIFGSQDWAANVRFPIEYFAAIDEICKLEVNAIYTAHDYYPYGYFVVGKNEVSAYLDACTEPLLKLRDLILRYPQASDAEIREAYNNSGRIPTVSEVVVASVRAVKDSLAV